MNAPGKHSNNTPMRRPTPRHFAAALCICLCLTSCIDFAANIEVSEDGSGTVRLAYTALTAMVNMGTIDEEDKFYTVPISREDFENTIAAMEGLTLRSFNLDEEVDTLQIEATLDYDSPESLSELFSSSGPGAVEIVSDGEETVYRHIIYGGSGEEIDEESRELIETFFSDYSVEFSITAPVDIRSTNLGEFSGREATVDLEMTEVLFSPQQIVWEVRW